MLNYNISDYTMCSNCGACYNICPVSAISLCETGTFYKFEVNDELCLHCGECVKVCPLQGKEEESKLIGAYWAIHKSKNVVLTSSSGGAYQALADFVIHKKNGVVFSAAYSENCSRVEIMDSENATLSQFKRSKYVESIVGKSFREVKKYLNEGRYVMYCGTPCQVAGLHRYIGGKKQNLLLCDFSCGGVPSHQLYQDYLNQLELKYNSQVKNVNFRSKRYGWGVHGIEIEFSNEKKYISPAILDPYFYGFVGKHITVRDECYHCKFANNHCSDIILADFWRYKKFGLSNNKTGISLILTNSLEGESVIHEIEPEIDIHSIDIKDASYNIIKQKYSESFLNYKDEFIRDYEKNGYTYVAKKYLTAPPKDRIEIRLKSAIKSIINSKNKMR